MLKCNTSHITYMSHSLNVTPPHVCLFWNFCFFDNIRLDTVESSNSLYKSNPP